MDKVKIKITTTQTTDVAGNEDIIELVTEAYKELKDDHVIIDYDESNITENRSTRSRLKIYKDKMVMAKMGEISTRMEFEKNKTYANPYTTPYGTFDLDFNTFYYENNLDENGKGSISVKYKISFAGSEESLNDIIIDIY